MRQSIEYGSAKGRPPTPDQVAFLESEPEIDTGIAILCRAYSELSTCRSVGMAIGPIPWTAMIEWARHHELTRALTDYLINVLRIVDQETLRRESVRLKNRTPTNG